MGDEKQKTILLVEDEAVTAMTEKMILEKYGYKVITAYTGEEAAATVENTPGIDLVLMDINLGAGMDGTEAAAIILKEHDIPVVFLSSHTEPEVVEKTEKITSYGYVVKNSGDTVLQASIKMAFKLFEAKTKEREKEAALNFNKTKLELALHSSQMGVWQFNITENKRVFDNQACFLLGIDPGTFGGTAEEFFAAIHPDDREKVKAALKKNIAQDAPYAPEYRVVWPDGSVHFVSARGKLLHDDKGNPQMISGIIWDSTERKEAEEALRAAETRYRLLFEQSPDGIVIIDPATARLLEFNEAAHRQLGYSREEFARLSISDLEIVETPEETRSHIARVMHEGLNVFETRHRTRQGEIRDIHVTAQFTQLLGRPIYHCIWRDITERKRSEEALRESEERYRTLFETMDEGFCVVEMLYDPDGKAVDYRFVEINPAFEKQTGLQNALGKTMRQMVPDHDAHWFEIYGKVARTGEAIRFEKPAHAMQRYYNVFAFRVGGDGSKRVGIFFNDISERKRAEETLIEQSRIFEGFFENTVTQLVFLDKCFNFIRVNKAYAKSCQRDISEFPGHNHFEFYPSDAKAIFERVVETKEPFQAMAKPFVFPDHPEWGMTYWDWILTPILDNNGEVKYLVFSLNDVTERKQTEEKLREASLYFRSLIEASLDALVTISKDGKITDVNTATVSVTGVPRERLMGSDFSEYFTEPEKARKGYKQVFEKGLVKDYPLAIRHVSGSITDVLYNASVFKNADGQVAGVFAAARDISERKRAEEAQGIFKTIFENSRDGLNIADIETGKIYMVNSAICEMLGYTINELESFTITDIHPEKDLPNVLELFKKFGQEALLLAEEIPMKRKDGSVFYADISCTPITLRDRKCLMGSFRDITESRRAQAEIARQLAEKVILLKEVHHRIKNNIAAIGGLISLHLQAVTNPEAIAVLQDASSRVNSMRILYDKLLLSEDYKDISVKNYLDDLIDTIFAIFSKKPKIKLEKRIADFRLDAKRLFPLGSIINELLTNILKYAFINRDAGLIKISLAHADNHVSLTIQDNGGGLPAGFDIDKSKGLGLTLVKMLSQQLGGSFSIKKRAGTLCKVEFDI